MADSTIVFVILGAVVVLFVSNRVPVEIVAVGTALALWATGVLDINEALAGFGDPTVVYIAALFIVSEALDATGVTAWAGQQLVARAGSSRTRLLVLTMLLCAGLTALISVNGAVAALIPVVVVTAVRLHESPSRLLMPMAFAAHAGSMLALTGSPVNVIVSNAAKDAGGDYFGFFEFTLRRRAAARRHRRHRPASRRAARRRRATRATSPRTSATTPARWLATTSSTTRRPVRSTTGAPVSPRWSSLHGRGSSATRCSRGWSPTAATSWCSPCTATAKTSARARPFSSQATRCCCKAAGTPSRRTSTIPTCSSSTHHRRCAARPCRSDQVPSGRRSSSS